MEAETLREGATKTRRGGRGQRLAAANQERPPEIESKLALSLLYNVAWGIFPPRTANAMSSLALEEFKEASKFGSSLPMLEKIAAA